MDQTMSIAIFLCLTLIISSFGSQSWSSVPWFLELNTSRSNFVGAALCGRPLCGNERVTNDQGGHGLPPLQYARWIFYFDGLRGNPDDDVVGLDVACDDGASSDHGVVADGRAGQHRGVVREPDAVADPGLWRLDVMNVVDIMVVRIDVGVVRNRNVIADVDAAAIVEEHV